MILRNRKNTRAKKTPPDIPYIELFLSLSSIICRFKLMMLFVVVRAAKLK